MCSCSFHWRLSSSRSTSCWRGKLFSLNEAYLFISGNYCCKNSQQNLDIWCSYVNTVVLGSQSKLPFWQHHQSRSLCSSELNIPRSPIHYHCASGNTEELLFSKQKDLCNSAEPFVGMLIWNMPSTLLLNPWVSKWVLNILVEKFMWLFDVHMSSEEVWLHFRLFLGEGLKDQEVYHFIRANGRNSGLLGRISAAGIHADTGRRGDW